MRARAMINVAVIEDNRLVREGITSMLDELPDVTVVLAIPNLESAELREAEPRVVLINVGLGGRSSLQLAETVKQTMEKADVIVMNFLPVQEDMVQFVSAGVAGFILKDATFDELVGTIRSVAAGGCVLPPRMTGMQFSEIAEATVVPGCEAPLAPAHLTQRERQVMALLAAGMSNNEIAHRLDIALYTVKSHIRNIMDKLTLHSRLQIAVYAHEHDEWSAAGPVDGRPTNRIARKAYCSVTRFGDMCR